MHHSIDLRWPAVPMGTRIHLSGNIDDIVEGLAFLEDEIKLSFIVRVSRAIGRLLKRTGPHTEGGES